MVPNRDEVRSRLAPLFQRPDVRLVVLFGSVAKGREREGSDVDLGLIADGGIEPLIPEVIRLLHTDRVDVVDLRRASPLLAFSAARHGIPLHQGTRGAFASFASLSLRRYEDTRKLRKLREESLRRYARDVEARGAEAKPK
jgi:predicted nucleotidyltransferase